MNAEFQRIARRDKKAFLSDQCKEIEENNRMGKTRDLFKKIRDTKGIFHAKMSTSWNQDDQEKINNLKYADDTILNAESEEELKNFLMKVKQSEKTWVKIQHSENEDHGIWFYHFMANKWGKSGNSVRFHFLGLQNHCGW